MSTRNVSDAAADILIIRSKGRYAVLKSADTNVDPRYSRRASRTLSSRRSIALCTELLVQESVESGTLLYIPVKQLPGNGIYPVRIDSVVRLRASHCDTLVP